MRILLSTALDQMSGYGNDGVGLATALQRSGHDVHLLPRFVTPPITRPVAELLMKAPPPFEPNVFDVGIVHLPPLDLRAENLRPLCQRLVAWTMYEWLQLRWKGWEQVRDDLRATGYDALLVYDEVTKEAFSDPLVNPGIPLHILQGGYDPDYWAAVDPRSRDWSGPFRFVMVGRLDRRKGVWDAVKAFGQLKDRHGDAFDAELHLKTTVPNIVPPAVGERWPGIHVHLDWWTAQQLREFYQGAHCYLAPSTGEGKNLPALEASTTGIPAIATDWGGHTGWIATSYAYPLRWREKTYPEGVGAEPDFDHLVELMWHVYTHREEARQKGELARRTLPPMMSWNSVTTKLVTTLVRVETGGPPTGGAVAEGSGLSGAAGHSPPLEEERAG